MDIEKIGQFIKELRVENNLSQNQLSEEIHVTRQAVSNWENGKALPDSNVLLILSNLFKVSINEILSGKRLTKEDNLEEIALQLVDENNQKRNKIKKMMISFSTILSILVILFLGYYFVTNYNSIKVYRVSGKSDKFKTRDGIFIITRSKTYLHLGEIEKNNKDDSIDINKVILYYKRNNKKTILYERKSTNILVKGLGNYNEFISNTERTNIKGKLYIEIKYNNGKSDTIKLKLNEEFKNNFHKHNTKEHLKVIKDKPKPKNREEVFEKVNNDLSVAQEQLEVNSLLRRDDNTQSSKEDNSQPKQLENTENNIQVQKQETIMIPTTNNIEEDSDDNQNIVPVYEEVDSTKLDYDKIIQIIKEKGVEQLGSYVIEFMNNDTYYNISTQDGTINVLTSDSTTIETWSYIRNMNKFFYQKFENYEEKENYYFYDASSVEREINIISRFNNILNLLESQ